MSESLSQKFDPLRLHADALHRVLPPSEQPLFLNMAMYVPGDEQVGEAPSGWDFDLITGLTVDAWNSAISRAIQGVSLISQPDGIAVSAKQHSSEATYILLTTRAWYFVPQDFLDNPENHRQWHTWSCPVTEIVDIRRTPRAFGMWFRGWVAVTFADGSMIKLLMGLVTTRSARQLIQALATAKALQQPS